MARDYEDLHDLDDLSDSELRELVRQHLAADSVLDPDDLDVTVTDGKVMLAGRVGTDEERRIAEHIVSDVLGIENYENGIFVDPIRRGSTPEAIDDTLAEEYRQEGRLLGDRPRPESPEVESIEDHLDDLLQGTADVQSAIQEGTSWIPPEAPTPEGPTGAGEFGEDH